MSPAVAEAIAWIEQAEALLDQAASNLKGDYTGYGRESEWLRAKVDRLAKDIKGEAD
jgi:hypothetical protein